MYNYLYALHRKVDFMAEEKEPKLFSMSLEGAKAIYNYMADKPYKEVSTMMKHWESGKLAYETEEKKEEFKVETLKSL